MRSLNLPKKKALRHAVASAYWFSVGFVLAGALLASAVLFYFQYSYRDRVIPGVFIDNIYVGGKGKGEIQKIFTEKNEKIGLNTFIFTAQGLDATVSAKTLNIGYDVNLITEQSLSLGKTKNLLSDVYIILSSYINGVFLNSSYTYNTEGLEKELEGVQKIVYQEPQDAQFSVSNNRVVAFRQSSDGRSIDFEKLNSEVNDSIPGILKNNNTKITRVPIPIKIIKPRVTTEEANNLGIVEVIGTGRSTFFHSIPNRIHNISLAASRINGTLVAPNEEFSFAKALGDVSKFTGYKEAYVIQNGKTILGDGGGVCQVSTTLFRAILNAGLPITERHPHAYRVGYYEQDAPPGFDATVYVPSVDLKFKNDMATHILIQSYVDPTNLSLTFTFYGKKDGREVAITKPQVTNVTSPPPPLYQDDPTLPKGELKQVEYEALGGKSVFSRTVTKNGNVILNDTFISNYRSWQAVFLRGTKE